MNYQEFRWGIKHGLSNENSFSGSFHALGFEKYVIAYLGASSYRFNRRLQSGAQ